MKKILLKIVVIMIMLTGTVFAADNYLNAVILEGNGNEINNIVLRSDSIATVKRTFESSDNMILEVKGLKASEDLTTMYKNASAANRVVVENNGNNELTIQIQGKNIAKANIIFDSPASAPIVVSDGLSQKTIWLSILALFAICFGLAKTKKLDSDTNERIQNAVRKNIKDREIELYKNYRKELLVKPSIDYKITSPRMKRAIRQADTIRHLQRMSKV